MSSTTVVSSYGSEVTEWQRTSLPLADDPLALFQTSFEADIRARLDLEANAQLGFQRLVADLAARFSAIAPEELDATIVDSLRQTGEALQIDCAVLWRLEPGERVAVPTHSWVQPWYGWVPEPVPIAAI